MDYSPPAFSAHENSPGKNTGVGCHALLQGIFPTQGLNPGLLHCRRILYCLNHQGSPCLCLLQGIFLIQELNWGFLHCRQVLYQLSYQGNPKRDLDKYNNQQAVYGSYMDSFFFSLDSWGKLNIVVNDFKELLLLCVINAHDYVKKFVFAKCMLNCLWVKYVMFVLT